MRKLLTLHFKLSTFRGYTLTELMVYMGLLTIFLLVLTQVFSTVVGTQLRTEASSSVENDSRYIISRLGYDLQRATDVTTPVDLGDTDDSLELVIGGETYTYSLASDNLNLNNDAGDNVLNSYDSKISDLQFTRLGNEPGKATIRVSFTITSRVQAETIETKTVRTTFGLR